MLTCPPRSPVHRDSSPNHSPPKSLSLSSGLTYLLGINRLGVFQMDPVTHGGMVAADNDAGLLKLGHYSRRIGSLESKHCHAAYLSAVFGRSCLYMYRYYNEGPDKSKLNVARSKENVFW